MYFLGTTGFLVINNKILTNIDNNDNDFYDGDKFLVMKDEINESGYNNYDYYDYENNHTTNNNYYFKKYNSLLNKSYDNKIENDVIFKIYTRNNNKYGGELLNIIENHNLTDYFDDHKNTIFLAHGWTSLMDPYWCDNLKDGMQLRYFFFYFLQVLA